MPTSSSCPAVSSPSSFHLLLQKAPQTSLHSSFFTFLCFHQLSLARDSTQTQVSSRANTTKANHPAHTGSLVPGIEIWGLFAFLFSAVRVNREALLVVVASDNVPLEPFGLAHVGLVCFLSWFPLYSLLAVVVMPCRFLCPSAVSAHHSVC